jgi:hypothetical protein
MLHLSILTLISWFDLAMNWQSPAKDDSMIYDERIILDRRSQFLNWCEVKLPGFVSSKLFQNSRKWPGSLCFAIFGTAKFIAALFQNIPMLSRVGSYPLASQRIAIIFDLTRQHLPPAVPVSDLEEFFFNGNGELLKSGTNAVVILNSLSEKSFSLSDRLFSYSSLNQLIFAAKNSLPSKCWSLIKAFYKTITSLRICRNFLSQLGILPDLFAMNLFLGSDLKNNTTTAFVTTSSIYSYPSVFYLHKRVRLFETEMLHYSENTLPLTYKEFKEKGTPQWIFNSRVDTHKVWTNEYAKFLIATNPLLSVKVVGSMIFRPTKNSQIYKKRINQILVLDVNPSSRESKNGPYTELAGKRFLDCIENVQPFLASSYSPRPIFKIKSKRRRISAHSEKYIEHKMELIARGIVEEVPWQSNLYSLIAESSVVLCSIGTAPSLIARELGIPVAMFYSGENELMKPFVDYGIPLLQDTAAVYAFLSSHLENL